jgi:RHS repeat-associated protein
VRAPARTHAYEGIIRAYALTISNDRFARGHHVAMNTVHNNAVSASFTRRHLPPRCSRITTSRPNGSKTCPRTVFDSFVTTYQYSANGQLRSMTYPSGQTIAYTYGTPSSNNPGKITSLMLNPTGYNATSNGGNTPTGGVNILTSADYKPFGPNEGWDWGNTCTGSSTTCNATSNPPINQHLRSFDLDYRPSFIGNDPQGYSRNIAWDRANRITAITTPSGATIPGIANANSLNQAFAYDQLDRLTNFNAGTAGATTLATGMALLPTEQFSYDAIGNRLTRTTTPPGSSTASTANYAYPNTTATPAATRRHTLTALTGANAWTYAYDASGNTLAEGANAANAATTQYTMTYDAKNRLNKTQIGTNTADFVTYKINAMGQRVQKTGAGTYAYNAATASSFAFNARFVYDESGNLIGEYAPDGKLISETVWFNGMPIATLRPKGSNSGTPLGITGTTTGNPANGATAANANNAGNNTTSNRVNVEIFYVHSDHLGTPRVVTRSTIATGANAPSSATSTSPGSINKSVWMWNSDPFGTTGSTGAGGSANSAPNKNPQLVTGTAAQIAAGTFEQNLRMPGQFEDAETKKFYNYFRDYDASIGRYSTSDPIGLRGGLNTFGYVHQSPNRFADPFGLDVRVCYYADAASGLGHVGYGLPGESDTTGFYPYDPGLPGLMGPGVIARDRGHPATACKVLPATPDQDDCMADCRTDRTMNPGKYNLAFRQCTDFVRTCLARCKLGNYGGGPMPRDLFDQLPPVRHQ